MESRGLNQTPGSKREERRREEGVIGAPEDQRDPSVIQGDPVCTQTHNEELGPAKSLLPLGPAHREPAHRKLAH